MKRVLAFAALFFLAMTCVAQRSATKSTHITINAGAGLFIPAANNVSTNWQLAGVPGGIPNRTTQCGSALNPVGGVPSGTTGDDAHNITAAIAACTAGQFVLLNPGASTAINVSISGSTLTLNSGSLVIGDVIEGANIQTGTTITAGSGTSWTVSFPPYPGSTVSNEAAVAIVPYSVLQSEAPILINKGISIRGSGTCSGIASAPPICPVVINVEDGAIPSWSISGTDNNTNCGVNVATHTTTCPAASAVLLMSPNGNFTWGWGGACNTGSGANLPPTCGTFLATDVAQGATQIQVASTTSFLVGHWFLIDELPVVGTVTNPAGTSPTTIQGPTDSFNTAAAPATNKVISPDSPSCVNPGLCGTTLAWSLFPNRVNAELHKITAIGAGPCPGTNCTITFDSPLSIAFRQSGGHNAQAFWPTNGSNTTETPFLSGAGIENLSITRPVNGGIIMEFCTGCWIQGVEVGAWFDAGAKIRWSTRSEITFNWFHHGMNLTNNGIEYPFSLDAATTEVLVDNNIFNFGGKGMVGRAAGAGDVVAYNEVNISLYQQASIGNQWHDMGLNGSHYAGAHHILFEGNHSNNCDNDDTHGAGGYYTYFRNHCAGIRDTFVDPSNTALTVNDSIDQGYCGVLTCGAGVASVPAPMRAVGAMAWVYWPAYVGNLLGLAGVTTTGNGWAYTINAQVGPGQKNKGIRAFGWVGASFSATDSNLNAANPNPFLFMNHNYDYVNAGIIDNAAGFSQTLPNSLYAASKPAFFSTGACTYPWPWIDVNTSPFVLPNTGGAGCGGSGMPARARWLAGTPMVQP